MMGTVRPAEFFDPEEKARTLIRVTEGPGIDLNELIDIFCGCVNIQRQQIKQEFRKISGKDLQVVLEENLKTGDFTDVIIRMLHSPAELDAVELRHAMKVTEPEGPGMKEAVLMEILCTRKITHLEEVKLQYYKLFGRDLVSDVRGETSGHFLKLCEALLEEGRNEPGRDIDPEKAKRDARALFYAGTNVFLVEESIFLRILAHQSAPQLKLVFEEYNKIAGQDVEDAVRCEIDNPYLQKAYLTICEIVRNMTAFFAQSLEHSMKSDTSGPYEKILLRLIRE